MSTLNPNQTLLQSKNQSTSDLTPAPVGGSPNAVSFLFSGVQPPSNLYITRDDQLVILAASSLTNETVTVNVRLLEPGGRIQDNQFKIFPANTRTVISQTNPLAVGYLLSLSVLSAQATTRGQTFVRCFINRGAYGTGQPGQMLFADYVTQFLSSGYPNGRILAPTEGPGLVYTPTIANPGAGADWQINVPTNARWRVRGWNGLFTASAAVASRDVSFRVIYSGNFIFDASGLVAITASQAVNVTGVPLTPWTELLATEIIVPMPVDLVITPTLGNTVNISVLTANLQAGDTWTFIGLLVEEWLDNV